MRYKLQSEIFNELDKLPMLKSLCKTPKETGGFDDMFTLAVASISQLQVRVSMKT